MESTVLFAALMLSLASGSLTNYTLSSTDSSAYITEICVRTDNSSKHELISITATYNNGDVSGPFGLPATAGSTIGCFTMTEGNECITSAVTYTGYYHLNSLQFGTSSFRMSDEWGVHVATSEYRSYSPQGDEGTCLSKIEFTANSWSDRLVSIRFAFDAFEGADHSTTDEPISQNSTATLAETGCDGIQYAMDNTVVYLPAGVCSVVYDDEDEGTNSQYSTMAQCTEDGSDVVMNTYLNTECTGTAVSSMSYVNILAHRGADYRVFCGGNACHYGIRREYPTASCSDRTEEVQDKYSDMVMVMGCMNSMRYTCNDGVSINFTIYSDDRCMNGESFSGSFVNDACDEDTSHQYEIICGVAEVSDPKQDIVTETTVETVEKISVETTDHETEAEASNGSGWMLILLFVAVFCGFCVFFWVKRKWRRAKHDLMHHVMDSAVEAVVHKDHHHDYHQHDTPHHHGTHHVNHPDPHHHHHVDHHPSHHDTHSHVHHVHHEHHHHDRVC
eukprot:250111_1